MRITLSPELEVAVKAQAQRQGVAPEVLALHALQERFLGAAAPLPSRDEWERRLRGLAKHCGVSLPNAAVSSEGIYE